MARILVVDDDGHIREVVRFALTRAGHQVHEAADGRAALDLFAQAPFEAVVLDIVMPEEDGLEVCRKLRARSTVPILFLSSRDDELDRVLGLEIGADDYLTKPFSPRELVLRIRAILRRSQKVSISDELRVGDFVADRQNMVLLVDGEVADLTSTELKLICFLMANPDVVHSRSELLNAVWGYADDTHSRTLDTHVKRLRDKLGTHGNHIGTVRKQGYLFVSNPGKGAAR